MDAASAGGTIQAWPLSWLAAGGGICGLVLVAGVGGEGLRPACAWPWRPLSAPTQRPALLDALGALAAAPSPVPAAKPSAGATPASGSRPSRDVPVGTLLNSQPLATAAGGLLLTLLLADRLVLWKRPLWLLRFPDESLDLPIGAGNVLPLGSRLFRVLKYRPRVLDAWVEEHQGRIKTRFAALSTVKERRHHLGLPVLVEADLQGEESLLSRVRSSLEALSEQRGPEAKTPPPTLAMVHGAGDVGAKPAAGDPRSLLRAGR